MKIDVKDMTSPELEVDFTVQDSEFTVLPGDLILKDEIQIKGKIEKMGSELLWRGKVKTRVELECGRCLEHFSYPIEEKFEVIFQPMPAKPSEEEIELTRDDLDIEFYREDLIDLTEVVREQILLALPMIPICKEDCKGLCSQCGENLNYRQCSCTEEIDPRWAKLKNLVSIKKDAELN